MGEARKSRLTAPLNAAAVHSSRLHWRRADANSSPRSSSDERCALSRAMIAAVASSTAAFACAMSPRLIFSVMSPKPVKEIVTRQFDPRERRRRAGYVAAGLEAVRVEPAFDEERIRGGEI